MTHRRRFLAGLGWKALSQSVSFTIRFGLLIAWAHLLDPRDYGLAGMALVFIGVAYVLNDFALGTALVQRRALTESERSTVFWTAVALSAGLALVGVAASVPLATFYDEPDVGPLVAVLSAGLVIRSLGTVHVALFERNLAFRSTELAAVGGTAAGAGVGIAVAIAGYGPWAIVAQQLAATAVFAGFIWAQSPWRPTFAYSREAIRGYWRFSGNVLAARLASYGSRTADNLLIGKFLGPSALGAYALAYNLVIGPLAGVVDPVRVVLAPILAQLQDDRRRVASVWLRSLRSVAALVFPLMATAVIFGPELVQLLLGDEWSDSGPVIRILAAVATLQVLFGLNAVVLVALGETRMLRNVALRSFALNAAAFVVGLSWGIEGVAWAYLGANAIIAPWYAGVTAHTVGVRLRDVLSALRGTSEATLGAALAAGLVAWMAPGLGMAAQLALAICALSAVYAVLIRFRARDVAADAVLVWADLRSNVERTPSALQ